MSESKTPPESDDALEPAAELAAEHPYKPTDDREEIYFQGSPLIRGEIGMVTLWAVAGLVLIALVVLSWIMDWHFPWWISLVLVVVGILALLVPWVITKRVRYRISNYRIDYERGLFSTTIDTMELWHVDDIHYHQSLLDKILGVGNITVMSNDKTTPRLSLRSLPNPRPLFDTLKQRVIAVKRQRGVIKMDMG